MSLPGICIVCGRPVVWGGHAWREGSARGPRHRCRGQIAKPNALLSRDAGPDDRTMAA